MDVVSPFIELCKLFADKENEIRKEHKAERRRLREDIEAAVSLTAKYIDANPNRPASYELSLKWEALVLEIERLQRNNVLPQSKQYNELFSILNTKSEYWKRPERWTMDFKEAGITLSQVLSKAKEIE